jgi:signal transduction histidine kinase/CheY-like chemotaxis protein
MRRCATVLACALLAGPVQAQGPASHSRSDEVGRPLIHNYTAREYGASDQNWAIVHDDRGVVYVGNVGVLEYDGTTWRRIQLPNRNTVRSLAIGPDRRVYVGGLGEIGYLAPDASGVTQYVSLLDHVPDGDRTFADVWRTLVTPQGLFFQSEARLLRWKDGRMRAWTSPAGRFHRASEAHGRLYVPVPGAGLMDVDGDTFRLHPGTERFGDEIYPVVLPYDEGRVLIGTRGNGLYLYDGASVQPFPTEIDGFLRTQALYRASALPDGTFALATVLGGMAIIDRDGRREHLLDKAAGLNSDQVYYVAHDRTGVLWLGLERGIARVEIPSPITVYGERANVISGVSAIRRFQGDLYIATGLGVARLQPRAASADGAAAAVPWAEFRLLPGIAGQAWWFQPVRDLGPTPMLLLAGGLDGLFRVERDRAVPVFPGDTTARPMTLHRSRRDPARVWIGHFDGFSSIRWRDGRWEDEGRVEDLPDEVRTVFEDDDGRVWLGTQGTGLLRLDFGDEPADSSPPPTRRPRIERFGEAHGIPAGAAFVQAVGTTPYFLGVDGFYRFDAASTRFVRDDTFDETIGKDLELGGVGLVDGGHGRVYLNMGRESAVAVRQADGTWQVDTKPFARFADFVVGAMYADDDGVVWFGGGEGILRYDGRLARPQAVEFGALLRGASTAAGHTSLPLAPGEPPRLSAAQNAVRFEFAAPSYENERANQFQHVLEGLETEWSDWSTQPNREYMNLGFGDYRFRVRARNLYGVVSREAEYRFTILPPWYRTWWAYASYVALLGGALFAGARVQRRRLVAKERERARLREAQVRAEAAEALARAEASRIQHVELLSEIGKEITSSLDFDTIFFRLYEHVNTLADADVFGVGLYHPDRKQIEYRLAVEEGKRYAPYTRDTSNKEQFPVWCIEHRAPVFINDVDAEHGRYITTFEETPQALEDGSLSKRPQSLIYLPLLKQDRVLGIITIQSFEKHAYTEVHLRLLQSLAAYTSIALDNASAYRQLNEQEHEIRRLFEEAERARAAAEEADAAKSAFLSTVSHELRTPLTSVLGFAKITKKRLEERIFPAIQGDEPRLRQTMAQVRDNLQVVVGEGERLTKLIDDVLDLAKIEAGKLEWHMEPVTLTAIIDHATAATASLFDAKGLALVKDVPLDLPILTGDRDRLVQVVINLISNAVKFTDQGSVTCRAARRGNEIVVSVIDTGLGISPGDQPKVFEKFKQVGDTLTDKPKGTGLGLPICREIVEHHGGHIWVESEPGSGSTFSFSLPIVPGGAVSTRPVELESLVRQLRQQVVVSAPTTTERQASILIVDDDPHIRELLNQEFTEAGYRIRMAANGREALAEVRRERPDLVVLDVMMPEINGFDVAAVLKNDPQTLDIPIIILSIVQDRERGFRLGVDRYLTKPIDTGLLLREVDALIQQGTSHKRVLVVDEDEATVKTLVDVLTTRGYAVTEANGAQLVEKAVALQPDIIILSALLSQKHDVVQSLRFERGLENVVFVVYQ